MRVLITGGGGLLGGTLAALAPQGVEVHVTVRSTPAPAGVAHRVDLADDAVVLELFRRVRPALIIHTAYDPVDLASGVVRASAAVAAGCADVGAALIHLSSDRVLDGERSPYDEDAAPSPIDPYGVAKAEAERLVIQAVPGAALVRTSLIVGTDPPDRSSAGLVAALRRGERPTLFVDELRCPIHVRDLGAQIWEMAGVEDRAGVWNLAGPEALSRFALGMLIARRAGVDAGAIAPALNRALSSPRPRDLRLITARADARLVRRARPISEALFQEQL